MNALKTIAVLLATSVILLAPWPVGGNYPFVRTLFLGVSALLVLIGLIVQFQKEHRLAVSLVWLLIPAGIGYAIYQVLPSTQFSSEYPQGSKAVLYSLASAAGFFFASVAIFHQRRMIQSLMLAGAVVGVAVAFVGILQNLAGNGKVLWSYELLYGGVPFGPFVNKNNGAGFLIGCATGAVFFATFQILEWRRINRPHGISLAETKELSRKKKMFNPFTAAVNLLAALEAKHLYSLAALVVLIAGVLLSLSRGGSVGLVIAFTVALAMISISNRWVIVVALFVVAACVGLTAYVEQADSVAGRLSSIAEADDESSPRLLHWADAMPYYKDYWQQGSGLGTYRYKYPEYQQTPFRGKFFHAENVYLETLAELGWFGLTMLTMTAMTIFYHSIKLFRRTSTFDQALGVAGVFCIVGQAACSALDFGIYQPANFAVVGILLGAIVGRACSPGRSNSGAATKNSLLYSIGKPLAAVVLIAILAGCVYSVRPSYDVESISKAKRLIRLHERSFGRDMRKIDQAQQLLFEAEDTLSENWEHAYVLGETYIYQHREKLTKFVIEDIRATQLAELQAAADAAVPLRGQEHLPKKVIEPPKVMRDESDDLESTLPTYEQFWATSSVPNLHRLLRFTSRSNPAEYLTLRQDPNLVTEELKLAYECFKKAESRFPLAERPMYRLAQLSVVFDPPETNKQLELDYIAKVLELSKGNTGIAYDCGLLALFSGNQKLAIELWSDCILKSQRYEAPIVLFSMQELPLKSFFEEVLPQNPYYLLKISRKYFSEEAQTLPNKLLLVHTKRLINQGEMEPKEKFALLGKAHFLSGEFPEAVNNFRQAINLDPTQFEWRMDFAKSLHAIAEFDEAIKELKICQLESPRLRTRISRLINVVQRDRANPPVKPVPLYELDSKTTEQQSESQSNENQPESNENQTESKQDVSAETIKN
jgi:O-antigen ligase/tetratricopeptide (TPR) repeat protein